MPKAIKQPPSKLLKDQRRMSNQLPVWVTYLQAFSTPAIALLALVIGFFQWRTAHQRAVLDLFDRRMQSYDALNAAISEIVREGSVTFECLVRFSHAADRAKFLFGRDVSTYLQQTKETILKLRKAENGAHSENDETRTRAADLEAECLTKITQFYDEFFALVRPYMKQHQKGPRF
jgi:hypothetical protein